MGWGRPSACGSCGECDRCKRAAYMRKWYAAQTFEERRLRREGRDIEASRRRDRDRYQRMKDDDLFAARRRAVFAVNNAIKRGDLSRGTCEVCGAPDAHGHHDDYSKPLEVRWLCSEHHAAHHTKAA